MRYRPLPRNAARYVIIVTVMLLIGLGWAIYKHPEALLAPGDLSRFHADIAECKACHRPFHGADPNRCTTCHGENYFAASAKPNLSGLHRLIISEKRSCLGCHTEHRGALAQITVGTAPNPHGEFVFRATGTRSCSACHILGTDPKQSPKLLDNLIVKRLMREGEGAHRPGAMKNCLACHRRGRVEADD